MRPRRFLIVMLLGGGTAIGCRARDEPSRPDSALLDRLTQHGGIARTFAPRVSALETFRACPDSSAGLTGMPVSRCAATTGTAAPDWAFAISADVSSALRASPSSSALHAAGLVDLLWRNAAGTSLDRSISFLRGAARLSESADVLADLSAAYLVRSERQQTLFDLVEALEVANRAVKLSATNRAAQFNLALALERLGLVSEADIEWRRYLALDSTSDWAVEARERDVRQDHHRASSIELTAATSSADAAAFAANEPEAARTAGWDQVLGKWADATLGADSAAESEMIRLGHALGDALERGGGDATLADAVRAIDATAGDPAARLELAQGHAEFSRARADYSAQSYRTAAPRFRRVISQARRSPTLRQWATLFLGTSLVYLRQPAQGEALIAQVAHGADTVRHAGLAGRAYWSLGTTYLRAGGYAGAMTALHRASELFGRIGERQNRGAVAALEAEGHFDIGDAARGASALYTALALLRPNRQSVWLHNALWLGARESARAGYVGAASRFEAEDVRVARNSGLMAQVVEAHLSRARVMHAASADDSAASELAAARLAIRDVPPDLQPWLSADLRLSEAERVVRSDPARAVAALDSVIAYFGSDVSHPVRLIPALLARSQALMGLHDAGAATRDLSRAIDLIDARQDSIADLPERAQLLESARGTFDRIVMLHAANGGGRDALQFMERGRAVLRRAMGAREASGDAQHARSAAPAGVIDVDYALIGDTLLSWVVANTDVRFSRNTIDRRALRGRIDRVRTALELGSDQNATTADLAGLYDVLIRPIAKSLRDAAVLVVVPDAELADVPFPALLDTASHTFLVERYPLRVATSLVEAGRASRRASPDGKAVFVVDPAFDARAFQGLRRLTGAGREVRTIAPLYPTASTLAGVSATPRAFESAMATASVVHYAGHSLFDDERPERSVLVLARDGRGRERGLTAERIARLHLDGVRLVVLSACETLRTRSVGSNGFTGLAGAFLAAGAGGVVGTLWRVDDATTPDLMFEFHRAFRASGDASAALREAQMAFLRSTDAARRSPAAWAGFRYVGT